MEGMEGRGLKQAHNCSEFILHTLLRRSDYGMSTVDMYVFSLPSVRHGKENFFVLTID
jgi:hypothetical protein